MARRPVYIPITKAPFVDVCIPEFPWNAGFSVTQKQKNIAALHEAFAKRFPNHKILEISSKSMQQIGKQLSAFNLMKEVPSIGKQVPVECVFQGGKVFSAGGPYIDLYTVSPKDAKRDPRLKSSGMLTNFYYEGITIPILPKTAFYNWLYIKALIENPEYAEQLLQFDAFTDIEFNPNASINCQAEAAAIFVSLSRLDLIEQCHNFDTFQTLLQKN